MNAIIILRKSPPWKATIKYFMGIDLNVTIDNPNKTAKPKEIAHSKKNILNMLNK